jgi:hypothetical protein
MAFVRCKQHGIFYDPAGPGCPICLVPTAVQEPGWGSRAASLAIRAGVVLAGIVVLAVGVRAVAGVGQEAHESAIDREKADPNRYRMEIEDVEYVIYSRKAPSPQTDVDIIKALEVLGYTMDAHRPTVPQARRSLVLWEVNDEVARLKHTHAGLVDMRPVQLKWEEVRGRLFHDADWFQQSEPVTAAAAPKLPPGARTELQLLSDLHAMLSNTIRSGRTQALYIGEPVERRSSTEGRRQQSEWDSVRESVRSGLESAYRHIPDDHPWSRHAQAALDHMKQAHMGLEVMFRRSSMPSLDARTSAFDRAIRYLGSAETSLKRMGG